MKKYLFLGILVIVLLNGCTSGNTESTVVVTDTTKVDTAVVDTTKVIDTLK